MGIIVTITTTTVITVIAIYLSQRPRSWNSMFLATWLERVQAEQGARSQPYTLSHVSQLLSTQLWFAS